MRRVVILVTVLCSLTLLGPRAVIAQEASPAASGGLADVGMPQLSVTVSATGYEGIPEQLEAGRYLVIVSVAEDAGEFGGGVAFVQPGEGMSAQDFLSGIFGPPDQSGVGLADASPIAEVEASPADGGETGGPPDFIFDATFAGGTAAPAGGASQVVLDLTPGEWIAWADDPEAPQEPVTFEVTGEMPAELPEPDANAVITMGEYLIEITEGELLAGRNIVRINNIGAQPHFIVAAKGPDDMNLEQVGVVLEEEMQAEMSGTPVAYSDLDPNTDFAEGPFTGTQSMNTSIWVEFALEPGRYVLVCFFPDLGDGVPHAYHGMYNVVEVTG